MINKLRFYTSILCAHTIALALKIANPTGGTSFVGKMILKICPDFLKFCPSYFKKDKITVTGTNGKTTTCALISKFLQAEGDKVVHNSLGANMIQGIANVMALNILPCKRFDDCVLECDEAYLTKLYDDVKADWLLVTNLFRDQLDRYGEIDTTYLKIKEAIDKNPDLRLVLNADDPIVSSLADGHKTVFFSMKTVDGNAIIPVKPEIGMEHAGLKIDYEGHVEIFADYSILKVRHADKEFEFKVGILGLYNAYNALAAISLALERGCEPKNIQHALDTYKAVFGRTERATLKGRPTIIQLIKNPAGAGEVLKTVDLKSRILIAINDNFADGRDISWFWDTDFERLKDVENPIITSGFRANDIALRLKYAGVPTEKIVVEPQLNKALDKLIAMSDVSDKITILPSYTVLTKMRAKKVY